MENTEIKLSYEACVAELKIAHSEILSYQSENESLKKENEKLRAIIHRHEDKEYGLKCEIDAYTHCIRIMAGSKRK